MYKDGHPRPIDLKTPAATTTKLLSEKKMDARG
jgi:hypothetical protein